MSPDFDGSTDDSLDTELEVLAAHQRELDALASQRFRAGAVLTVAMLVVYFAFILLVAFNKEFLGELITDGLSVGIVLGVVVILATWALVLIYVRWANRVYEPALRRLRER